MGQPLASEALATARKTRAWSHHRSIWQITLSSRFRQWREPGNFTVHSDHNTSEPTATRDRHKGRHQKDTILRSRNSGARRQSVRVKKSLSMLCLAMYVHAHMEGKT